jgi:hypothetical protein
MSIPSNTTPLASYTSTEPVELVCDSFLLIISSTRCLFIWDDTEKYDTSLSRGPRSFFISTVPAHDAIDSKDNAPTTDAVLFLLLREVIIIPLSVVVVVSWMSGSGGVLTSAIDRS